MASVLHFIWPLPGQGLRAGSIGCFAPTLLLWGEKDALVSPVYGEEFAGLLRSSETVLIPDAGHLPSSSSSKRPARPSWTSSTAPDALGTHSGGLTPPLPCAGMDHTYRVTEIVGNQPGRCGGGHRQRRRPRVPDPAEPRLFESPRSEGRSKTAR